MYDINELTEVKKPIKKLVVFLPKQCPFRMYASQYLTENDKEVCSLNIKQGKDVACICTDKQWLEGCPLLNSSFTVEKN